MNAEPFSYLVVADDIPPEGRRFHIEANEVERRGLAESLGIPEVVELTADVQVSRAGGRALRLTGAVRAAVVQTDVVTLEPVRQEVSEPIDLTLLPAEQAERGGRGAPSLADAIGVEGPEHYRYGRVDLGAIAAEHLALGLDPYPRAPGTEFAGHTEDEAGADTSPFAVLARLKQRDEP
jgi:hypothetical protein